MAERVKATAEDIEGDAARQALNDLLPALQRLDHLLEQAVASAQETYGPEAASDPYRGLYITRDEAKRLLSRAPGAATLQAEGGNAEEFERGRARDGSRLAWLQWAFSLSPFDVDLILIALAPELDLRYERLYAYLQDDVTRRRPSIDLALNLLCSSLDMKVARRAHFASNAPLIQHDLIHLIPDPNQVQPPLLSHYLKLDDQIVHWLLGQKNLDARLAPFCQIVGPGSSPREAALNADVRQVLPALINQALESGQPLRLYFHGPRGGSKRRAAEGLASAVDTPLLIADLARAVTNDTDFEPRLKLLFHEAWLQDAILYLDGLDALRSDERHPERLQLYQRLMTELANDAGVTILAGTEPWVPIERGPTGIVVVPFPIPDFAQRRAHWETHLATAGVTLAPDDLNALANRFRLTPSQIADAVDTAGNYASWRAASRAGDEARALGSDQPTLSDLFSAARTESGHNLATLAYKIEPIHRWGDIVLPEDALAQLREICQRVAQRHRVLGEWGFDRMLSLGKGISALFAGPSGTGKTTAAEIIANELGLDLYRIDLSAVVSKYIGETEKNLERVFTAAETANAILFFDEADALFGKRSEVHDAHDRYANIEIAYLLQKMEQYDGLAILATNLRQNMDEAFTRRLQFIVEFPFPDESQRYRIWQLHFPPETPRDEDIDFDFLAKQFRLSGGNIKNIVLSAAFLAAAENAPLGMEHLLQATRREYQKMGKLWSEAEFNSYREHARSKVRRNDGSRDG
ncbi:MAG: ATP-binding protein [Ardenticatenaceae bacterium]|nr:ATP-binding protein [Ardenticatenaceae bacterium]